MTNAGWVRNKDLPQNVSAARASGHRSLIFLQDWRPLSVNFRRSTKSIFIFLQANQSVHKIISTSEEILGYADNLCRTEISLCSNSSYTYKKNSK